jgi:hypothetical protein
LKRSSEPHKATRDARRGWRVGLPAGPDSGGIVGSANGNDAPPFGDSTPAWKLRGSSAGVAEGASPDRFQ